jgi:hypothetical protein
MPDGDKLAVIAKLAEVNLTVPPELIPLSFS